MTQASMRGLAQMKRRPPFANPSGYQWPRLAPSKDAQLAFSARLNELLEERNLSHVDVALKVYGGSPKRGGKVQVHGLGTLRDWMRGKAWPRADRAADLAHVFDVPLESLTTSRAPFVMPHIGRGFKKRGNGHASTAPAASKNGHANGNGHALSATVPAPVSFTKADEEPAVSTAPAWSAPAAPVLPPDAPPLSIGFTTCEHNGTAFAILNITGTVPLEDGLSVVAMLYPEKRRHHRKQ